MKAGEVLKILKISRPTLKKLREENIIKSTKLLSGYYDFDEESVYLYLNKGVKRKNYIYARVSTNKQKQDLINQVNILKNFCFQQGIQINGIYQDVASGIDFEKRKQFFDMLDDILDKKVNNVIITYKDRLSRVGFNLFKYLFKKFGTNIIIMSEVGSEKLDSQEIFEEIVSLLHCYSMKLYSSRKNKKIKELINEND